MEIKYLGHGSFKFVTSSGVKCYIDPFMGDDYSEPADLVLITHHHYDHDQIGKVNQKDGCIVIDNNNAMEAGKNYKTFEILGLTINAVPAYNHHHKREECVGFIIDENGKKVYFPGDTAVTEEMKDYAALNIDLMFVPCDGIYTMTLEEAEAAAALVAPKRSVPIHNAAKGIIRAYSEKVASSYKGVGATMVRPGETIEL